MASRTMDEVIELLRVRDFAAAELAMTQVAAECMTPDPTLAATYEALQSCVGHYVRKTKDQSQ